jgi:23S rRNA (cytosine1962-C5)-methyltransferase
MFKSSEYELLDFGAGRKLERFAGCVLDRPAPAADGVAISNPAIWKSANACFDRTDRDQEKWSTHAPLLDPWRMNFDRVSLELKLTDFGHVGVFPEHAGTWPWLDERARSTGPPLKVLNLFAYTGGATLALAAAGAEVVHVDSARSSVAWARRNAEHSSLTDAPIRWIVEDARKFVDRELKRGNHYDAVILDPPSYGHGPNGEAWKIANDLPALLANCFALTNNRPRFLLLSLHTAGFDRRGMQDLLNTACSGAGDVAQIAPLELASPSGRRLSCGIQVKLSY